MCDIIITTGIMRDFLRDFPNDSKAKRKQLAKSFSHIHREPVICRKEDEIEFAWPREYGGE